MAFDIFYSGKEQHEINNKLSELFKKNPIVQRTHRNAPRKKVSSIISLGFQKSQKNMFFKFIA